MKLSFRLLLVIVPLAVMSRVWADTTYICQKGGQIREIHLVFEVEGQSVPCSVFYRKASGDQVLWKAESEQGYCEAKTEAFVEKQRSWGWRCEIDAGETVDADAVPKEQAEEAEAL